MPRTHRPRGLTLKHVCAPPFERLMIAFESYTELCMLELTEAPTVFALPALRAAAVALFVFLSLHRRTML